MAVSITSTTGAVVGHEQGAEPNVQIIQIDGLVKWFDVGRGYGFIIPNNGMPDL
jgi:CspA family cold shock protein